MDAVGVTAHLGAPGTAYRNLVDPSFVTTPQVTVFSLKLFVCAFT